MIKKALGLLVIAFIAFYLLSSPVGAADSLRNAVDGLMDAFAQIARFFDRLVA